jgi:hypothetical protein
MGATAYYGVDRLGAPFCQHPTFRAPVRRTIDDYKLFGRNRMRKLLSAVVLAMSVMFVHACGKGGLPHPGPDGGAEAVPDTYWPGSWDLVRVGTAPAPFFSLPDLILSESFTINADKSWSWTRLRQTHDSSKTPIGTKNQTLTQTGGTWQVISGEIKGIRLMGTYANTTVNPPRTAGGTIQYDVTPLPDIDFIQVRIGGANWDYVRRK